MVSWNGSSMPCKEDMNQTRPVKMADTTSSQAISLLANHYYRWNTAVAEVFFSGHYAPPSTLAEPGSPA